MPISFIYFLFSFHSFSLLILFPINKGNFLGAFPYLFYVVLN